MANENGGFGKSSDTSNEYVRIQNRDAGKIVSPTNRPDSNSGYRRSGYNNNPVTE